MLLQSTLKGWCWCLAALAPLSIKRGAILSPHCVLLSLTDKSASSWMTALQSIGGFHTTEMKICIWCNSSTYLKTQRGLFCLLGETILSFSLTVKIYAKEGFMNLGIWECGMCLLFVLITCSLIHNWISSLIWAPRDKFQHKSRE